MTYLGVEIVTFPSGMGGVLPAAVAARYEDGTAQIICLHEEYFSNWLLTVKQEELKHCSCRLTEFAKQIIKERKSL